MGVIRTRIRYEKKLPTFYQIQEQFKKQTGLDIQIRASLNLVELPQSSRQVIEKLVHDIDKYEQGKRQSINYINYFRLFNSKFYGIEFQVKDRTIKIEYYVRQFYFAVSLTKALLDLGGKPVNSDNQIPNEWSIPKKWKKLKHWDDYRWYNRPKK